MNTSIQRTGKKRDYCTHVIKRDNLVSDKRTYFLKVFSNKQIKQGCFLSRKSLGELKNPRGP